MSTVEITKNNPVGIIVFDAYHQDETLSAAAAVTYAAGTILGRITANGNLTHYTAGAADGSQTPVAVLGAEEVFAAAGTRAIRPIVKGRLRRGDLVIQAGGAVSKALADQLRSMGILSDEVGQLAEFDNE